MYEKSVPEPTVPDRPLVVLAHASANSYIIRAGYKGYIAGTVFHENIRALFFTHAPIIRIDEGHNDEGATTVAKNARTNQSSELTSEQGEDKSSKRRHQSAEQRQKTTTTKSADDSNTQATVAMRREDIGDEGTKHKDEQT